MRIFLTGATGWVGSAVLDDLLEHGYEVAALVRSDEKAQALYSRRVEPILSTLEDSEILAEAVSNADAVIHTGFQHDWARFAEMAEQDARAIQAMGKALSRDMPMIVTSGLSGLRLGVTEAEGPIAGSVRKSEAAAVSLREHGLRVVSVRLACSVHGAGDTAFTPMLISIAKKTGVSAYIGDGSNCWSGVARRDAARVYRLALEAGLPLETYHAVADEAVPLIHIAGKIGANLNLPVEARAPEHFGAFARNAGATMSASSAETRKAINWTPEGPSLLVDLDQAEYYT